MGFIALAQAKRGVFVATEVGYYLVNTGLLVVGIKVFGLSGAGIATFISYSLLVVCYRLVTSRLSGFKWSPSSLSVLLPMILCTVGVFLSATLMNHPWDSIVATTISLGVAVGSIFRLKHVLQMNPFALIRKMVGI